jgi:PEGA domain
LRKYLLATTAACLAGLLFIASCGREAPFFMPILTGEIEVVSSVPNADILLNGLTTGLVTPDTIPDLEIGSYRVSVSLASHAVNPAFIDVEVLEKQVVRADFTLDLVGVGSIAVTSTPPGAAILLDDIATGLTTPDTIPNVLIGTHSVTVALDGYEPDPPLRSIDVQEDQVHVADFNLSIPPPAVVLLEEFSNVDCAGCPDMAAVTHALQSSDGYGLDRVLLVNISGTFPDPFDPHYQAAADAHDARLVFYDAVTGLNFPSLFLNGAMIYEANAGVPALGLGDLMDEVDARLAGNPGFTISVDADVDLTEIPVTVTLSSMRNVDLGGYRLGVYLAEAELVYPRGAPGSNGQSTFHWLLRDYDQVDSIPATLAADVPAVLNASLTRNLAWNDVIVIAFIQHGTTRQILQAGYIGGTP